MSKQLQSIARFVLHRPDELALGTVAVIAQVRGRAAVCARPLRQPRSATAASPRCSRYFRAGWSSARRAIASASRRFRRSRHNGAAAGGRAAPGYLRSLGKCPSGRRPGKFAGSSFLRLWLRRGTLDPFCAGNLARIGWKEMAQWTDMRGSGLFPIGVVGHWPAGNIEIQPVLSLTCALLRGQCLYRADSFGIIGNQQRIMEKTRQGRPGWNPDPANIHGTFDHARLDFNGQWPKR